MRRHRAYSIINISGLAVGIACCVMILLWVMFEFSFDKFNANKDRIYRVAELTQRSDGFHRERASAGTPLGPAIAAECPSVESVSRLYRLDGVVSASGKVFKERQLMFADSGIFDIFSLPLLRGDPRTALGRPFSVVITPAMARKYFGNADPIGQILKFDKEFEFTVTGILAPIPLNSHVQCQFLGSLSSLTRSWRGFNENWDSPVYTYLLLKRGSSPEQLTARFASVVRKYRGEEVATNVKLFLQPLLDIHLHSQLAGELEQKTDIATLYQYAGLALFILLVACINFINLATAQATRRAREVGIRKVLGGSRGDLIRLYLGESIVTAAFATLIAVALVELLRPIFSSLVGAPVTYHSVPPVLIVVCLIAIPVGVGTFAGIFPALYLTAFRPSEVLKGSYASGPNRAIMRKGMVVFQFTFAALLLVCTIIGYNQLHHLLSKDLGFEKSGLIILPLDSPDLRARREILANKLSTHKGISGVAAASNIPGESDCHGLRFKRPNGKGFISLPALWIDHNYVKTVGLKLEQGRAREAGDAIAVGSAMLNESAVKALQLNEPIGSELISYSSDDELTPMYTSSVVGVVKDFNFRDLSYRMQPLVIINDPRRCDELLIRVRPGSETETIGRIQHDWVTLFPDHPFTYTRLEDFLADNYAQTRHFATVLSYSTLLAVFVACIGLFGLASFTVLQRTKEIGIRRVLGASSLTIILLSTREFLFAVVAANIVAWPIAYLLMRWWLQGYVYRVSMTAVPYLTAGLGTVGIALLTVGYQAIRAARSNPVESLKYE